MALDEAPTKLCTVNAVVARRLPWNALSLPCADTNGNFCNIFVMAVSRLLGNRGGTMLWYYKGKHRYDVA